MPLSLYDAWLATAFACENDQVRDMDAEIKFFTEGLGMKVMRQRDVGGVRNVFVAYGPESLKVKDGGTIRNVHFPPAVALLEI